MTRSSFKGKASHLAALAIAAYASHSAWSLMANSPLPPGPQAPIEYMKTQDLIAGVVSAENARLPQLLTAALAPFLGLAVGAMMVGALFLGLYVLSVYALTKCISGRYSAALTATAAVALFPLVQETLFLGDYGTLTGLTIATAAAAAMLRYLLRPSSPSFAAALLLTLLLPVAEPSLALAVLPVVASMVVYMYARRRKGAGPLLALAIGLSTLTLIYVGWGEEAFQGPLEAISLHAVLNYPITLILLVSSFLLGVYLLHRRSRSDALAIALTWTLVLAVYSVAIDPRVFLLAASMMLGVAAYPAVLLCEAFSVTERANVEVEGGGEEPIVYEVEVQVHKLAAALLPLLLASSIIISGALAMPNLYYQNWVYPEKLQDLQSLTSWINSEAGTSTIAAHTSIANWLAALSSGNILVAKDWRSYMAVDTLTSSAFRIATCHLIIDEWGPFSAARAPYIYAYNGDDYVPLLYIDDSYVRATLLDEEGYTWTESPYRARFMGYRWLEGADSISLILWYTTPGLQIEKTIKASLREPCVNVTYKATPRRNVTLIRMALPIYMEPLATACTPTLTGSQASLRVAGETVTITYLGNPEVALIETWWQSALNASFKPVNNSITAEVSIHIPTAKSTRNSPWYGSLLGLLQDYEVDYLITPRLRLNHLEGAETKPTLSLYLVDAYVRFLVDSQGQGWVEAPAYAEVLEDNEQVEEGLYLREVKYRTAGLTIVKTVESRGNTTMISYHAEPWKPQTYLASLNLTIWVPWERELKAYNVSGSQATLTLDTGTFNLLFTGNLSSLSVGPHPEYGQTCIQAKFTLNPLQDSVALQITSPPATTITYEATTRPIMESCDTLQLYVERGFLKPVYTAQLYKVYEVVLAP